MALPYEFPVWIREVSIVRCRSSVRHEYRHCEAFCLALAPAPLLLLLSFCTFLADPPHSQSVHCCPQCLERHNQLSAICESIRWCHSAFKSPGRLLHLEHGGSGSCSGSRLTYFHGLAASVLIPKRGSDCFENRHICNFSPPLLCCRLLIGSRPFSGSASSCLHRCHRPRTLSLSAGRGTDSDGHNRPHSNTRGRSPIAAWTIVENPQ